VRKALLPPVLEKVAAARRCYDRSGVQETAIAALVFSLESSAREAMISSVQTRQLQGDPGATAAARNCLRTELEEHLPIRATNAGPLTWPLYRGLYPKILTLYLGRGVDLFSGSAVSGPSEDRTP
jgi:hypothetical protein